MSLKNGLIGLITPQGANKMTKENTSRRLFNRLFKCLFVVTVLSISSLSFGLNTGGDGFSDTNDWSSECDELF